MKPKDLRPYLGEPCQVRIRCRACGGQHLMGGELAPGPNQGEVLLEGHRYSVEDIDEVRATVPQYSSRPAGRERFLRSSLLLLGGLAVLSTWIHLATPH